VSTQLSQPIITQGRNWDLPTSSQRQPGGMPRRWPGGIEGGLAATVLAALSLFSMLCYGMASAVTAQNGYATMRLRREIEDLRAHEALLGYDINLTQSKQRIVQAAVRLDLQPADPVREVDYVSIPSPAPEGGPQLAAGGAEDEERGLGAVLAEMVGSAGGRAEASTGEGHRF